MKIIRLFFSLLILLTTVATASAKEDWSVVERCFDVATEPIPLQDAPFEGTIYISNLDGVRAARNTMDTTYMVAFNNIHRSFSGFGSFSPDGRLFAYPTGYSYQQTGIDWSYHFQRIHFVDTQTGIQVFTVPTSRAIFFISESGSANAVAYHPLKNWLSNVEFLTPDGHVVNVETQEIEPYDGDLAALPHLNEGLIQDHRAIEIEVINHSLFSNLEFFSMKFLIDGKEVWKKVVFDKQTQEIYTFCDEVEHFMRQFTTIAFSPDDRYMALMSATQTSGLMIVDLESWVTFRIDINLRSGSLIGWWY